MKKVRACALRGRGQNNTQMLEIGVGIANAITTVSKDSMIMLEDMIKYRIRKLTPRECFRLMGVNDKDIDKLYCSGISNSQMYKMAGNSIVVDVLYHIFRQAFTSHTDEAEVGEQLSLF